MATCGCDTSEAVDLARQVKKHTLFMCSCKRFSQQVKVVLHLRPSCLPWFSQVFIMLAFATTCLALVSFVHCIQPWECRTHAPSALAVLACCCTHGDICSLCAMPATSTTATMVAMCCDAECTILPVWPWLPAVRAIMLRHLLVGLFNPIHTTVLESIHGVHGILPLTSALLLFYFQR